MKKITLLFTVMICMSTSAQQTISFETTEGFTLGDLNAQNSWAVTGCGVNCFVSNQVVSNEQATDGTNSLKIAPDTAFGTTNGVIFGGFYDFAAPVNYADAIISYDVLITQQDGNSSDFRFGVTGNDPTFVSFFTYLIDFNFQGNIRIVDRVGDFINVGTWAVNTWYNVRAEVTGSNIVYFVDDVRVATSILLNDFDFVSVRFVHDNFAGEGYIDNLRINNEALSTGEVSQNSFTHRYNKNFKTLNLESSANSMTNVDIYSLLGQRVISKSLSNTTETIKVASLNDGVYIAKVNMDGNSKTVKFVKN